MHFGYVTKLINFIFQCLLTTQQSQLDSEENLIKLLQGEAARLKSAIQLERHDRRSIDERCVRIEAQLRGSEAGTRGAENDAASGQIVRREWEKHEAHANQSTKTLLEFYKQDEMKLKVIMFCGKNTILYLSMFIYARYKENEFK